MSPAAGEPNGMLNGAELASLAAMDRRPMQIVTDRSPGDVVWVPRTAAGPVGRLLLLESRAVPGRVCKIKAETDRLTA